MSENPFQESLFDLGTDAVPAGRAASCPTDPTLAADDMVVRFFWSHVIRSSRCWYWTGAISTPDGYGRVNWRRNNRQRTLSAHRFALMLSHPALSDQVVGAHRCNMPLCVRVDAAHVGIESQSANIAYAVTLGRHRGPHPQSVINRAALSLGVREYLLGGGDPDRVPFTSDTTMVGSSDNELHLF